MANQLEAAAMHKVNFFAQPIAILFWYISYLCGKGQGKGGMTTKTMQSSSLWSLMTKEIRTKLNSYQLEL